jgi:hypothetical protein
MNHGPASRRSRRTCTTATSPRARLAARARAAAEAGRPGLTATAARRRRRGGARRPGGAAAARRHGLGCARALRRAIAGRVPSGRLRRLRGRRERIGRHRRGFRSDCRRRRPAALDPYSSILPQALLVGLELPVGHRHLGLELLDRAAATATRMKSWKARAGAVPPCRPAIGRASSRPIHTPVVRPLEKPMNQPSLFELVVPVLPATGRPICAARPVPDSTADCSRSVISAATHGATSTRSSAAACW